MSSTTVAELGVLGQPLQLGLEHGGAGEVQLAASGATIATVPFRVVSKSSLGIAGAKLKPRARREECVPRDTTAAIRLLRSRDLAPRARPRLRVPRRRGPPDHRSRGRSRGSASWASRPRGRTSGSARTRAGTCRRRASTPPAASSTSTTTPGAPGATPRSSTTWCASPTRCRSCASTSRPTSTATSSTRERVLACAVRLLDRGFFRIGSEEYAVENESYGLATMRKEHVTIARDGEMVFDYPAKSGKRRVQAVVDPLATEIVARAQAPPRRRRRSCSPTRTGGAGATCARTTSTPTSRRRPATTSRPRTSGPGTRPCSPPSRCPCRGEVAGSKTGRKRAITRAIKEIAHYLGNTPAVCRASYIDPRVFDAYRGGS